MGHAGIARCDVGSVERLLQKDSWTLGPELGIELRDVRNKWAHQKTFSTDDAYRAVDSISRLLTAVAAAEVEQTDQMKAEILRVKFDEQVRGQKRKESSIAVEGKPAGWASSVA